MGFNIDIAGAKRAVIAALNSVGITEAPPADGPRFLGLDARPLDVDWLGKSAPQASTVELTSRVQDAIAGISTRRDAQPHIVGSGWRELDAQSFMLYVYVGEDDMAEPEQPPMLDLFILLLPNHYPDGAALLRVEGRVQSIGDMADEA